MGKVKRFSKKMLIRIEDRYMKGDSLEQIARKLKITVTDVKNGLHKIFTEEMKREEEIC